MIAKGEGENGQTIAYEVVAEAKAKLRLYLNDPLILKQLGMSDEELELYEHKLPIPIVIKGEVVLGKTSDGKTHYFFTHDNPDFIPVFFDLETAKLHKPSLKSHRKKANTP